MTKKYIVSAVVLVALVVSAFAVVPLAQAAPKGKAHGYYSFPGNSLYGRLHNPHFSYKWGGEEFDDFQELIDHIRSYMHQWRYRVARDVRDGVQDDAEIDVDTLTARDIMNDSATLRGDVEFGDSDYADVWFVYGTKYPDLEERTDTMRIDDDDDGTFSEEIDDLNENDRYYYRAVGEDEQGERDYGSLRTFVTDDSDADEETPVAVTQAYLEVDSDTAELRGRVDMNDFDNGIVFFVYGLDEDLVEDVADKDTYEAIEEDGEDLQKVRVDSDLDGAESYEREVTNLDETETYYYRIGVEYEDEDGDETLELGSVRSFVLEENDDDEPDVVTLRAHEVDETSAELNGSVDMNDFDNGTVFYVYGTDALLLHDVEGTYDTYEDIEEDGNALQKVLVQNDLDGSDSFPEDVDELNEDTKYYYAIGVEYDAQEDEPTLRLGGLRSFTSD